MPPRVPQIAAGLALSAGLITFGLAITGTRIDALAPQQGGPAGLPPLPGSSATHTTLLIDGQPARVSECTTLDAPARVLERYEPQASKESALREVPYVLQTHGDGSGGGALVWTAPDGTRRAVLANAAPAGGTRYKLIEAPPPSLDPDRRLPGGVELPAGGRVVLSIERPGGGGFALLAVTAPPPVAADRVLAALAATGLAPEPTARALLSKREGPTTLPLADATGPRGVLVVAPDDRGGSRVSLTID